MGRFASGVGQSMQQLAMGWLLVQLADAAGAPQLAALYIGFVGLARTFPSIIMGLFGGVIADRFERRKLLWLCRGVAASTTLTLATLTLTGRISIPLILILAVVDAVSDAVDIPARQALLSRLVPDVAIVSAVNMYMGAIELTGIAGALVGGILIGPLGVGGVMLVDVGVYLFALAVLLGLPAVPIQPGARRTGVLAALAEGIRYSAREPVILWCIVLTAAGSLLARPLHPLLPAIAHNTLHVGAAELSWLLAVSSVGQIVGTLASASAGRVRRRGLLMVGAYVAWGAFQILFAAQTGLALALALILLPGVVSSIVSGTAQAVMQLRSPDALRGRVISLRVLAVTSLSQLGVMVLGTLGTAIGVNEAIATGGAVMVLSGLAVVAFVPAIRNLGSLAGDEATSPAA